MDKVERYREIIRETLRSFTERRYANADVTNEAIFDEARDHYLIVSTGWEGKTRRVYYSLVHLDIIDGKIWIQRDGTEDGIGYRLEAAGVAKSDIVPAFHPENVRPLTGYAAA